MALPYVNTNSLKVLPLLLGMSLLTACNSENTADSKNTQVADTQGCSRGALALFAVCNDQNLVTDELSPNNDTPPAGDTLVTTTGSGSDADSQSIEVVFSEVITPPIEATPITQPVQDMAPNYEEAIAQTSAPSFITARQFYPRIRTTI